MNGKSRLYFSLLVLVLGVNALADETSWLGWLGNDRNGWSESFEVPQKWPATLRKVWSVKTGIGYSSPIVSDGLVFQYGRDGENEVLACIDLSSGDVKWRKSYDVPFTMGQGGEWHGKGPKSAPALADGRLFTMSISGILSAWSAATGERLWYRDFNGEFTGKPTPYWGACVSPIVDDNRVIVHFGNDKEGFLAALNVESGDVVWRQGKDGAAYASPLLAEIDGVRQIVEWNHRAVAGVESSTGKLLWEFPFPHVGTNQNMPSPVFHDGKILVGGENRGIRCIQPKGSDGTWSATELWHQEKVALDMSTAVMNGANLFGFSHYGKGRLFSVASATGKIRWQGPQRLGQNATFLAIPKYVVVLLDNGVLQIVSAESASHEKVAEYKVAESPTWAPPVLLEHGILIKDHDTLTKWSFQ